MNTVILIGCGGVGSYLAPPLARTMKFALPNPRLVLMDGDTVEEKNINRQLFSDRDIGRNKAEALYRQFRKMTGDGIAISVETRYLAPQFEWSVPPDIDDIVICAVDNHVARRVILTEADQRGFLVIFAANEDAAAEAYAYRPEWKGHPYLDPRLRHPEILTDTTGDPVHPEGCTGDEALESAPQTAEANYVASALALRLFGAWAIKSREMEPEYHKFLPAHIQSTFSSIQTISVAEAQAKGEKAA